MYSLKYMYNIIAVDLPLKVILTW